MERSRYFLRFLLVGLFLYAAAPRGFAQAPTLSLKDSLPIAEKALVDAKVKIESYYLYSITYANSSKGNYWSYTYRPQTPKESNQVYVRVYADKTVEVRGGMEQA